MGKNKLNKSIIQDQSINPYQLFTVDDNYISMAQGLSRRQLKMTDSNIISRKHLVSVKKNDQNIQNVIQHSLTQECLHQENSLKNNTFQYHPFRKSALKNNLASYLNKNSNFKCNLNVRNRKPRCNELKEIFHRQKINNIIRNFANKLKRNNTSSATVQDPSQLINQQEQKWLEYEGIQLNQSFERFFQVVVIVTNFALLYYYSIYFAYSLQDTTMSSLPQSISLIIFISDLIVNLISVKVVSGRKISSLVEIASNYIQGYMMVDFILIAVIALDLSIEQRYLQYFKIIILAKVPYCLDKLQKLEIHLVQTQYKEQYWSLIKVFIFNFCYAHVLALLLTFMSKISNNQSWIVLKGIDDSPWYEIYIWAYYWAVNIMLTVGFGDIVASNYQEALCLIFIETISCIVLAYNINCVGSLISNIRAQDQQKTKKYKVFHSLARKQDISAQLEIKIANYINQSNNIKKKFNIEQQNKFIDSLPRLYKKDYLKESNKNIFQNIFFFRNLADRAIQSLAQSIEINISHPEENILSGENYLSLKILREGRVGFYCKKAGSLYHNKIIEEISIKEGEIPLLVGLQFLMLKKPNYQVKSLEYSVNYSLSYERLISSLKKSRGDYEYFFFLKDKSKYIIDQFEIIKCSNCPTNHTKFNCPKLHYIPIIQHVIDRQIYSCKKGKSKRMFFQRIKFTNYNALVNFQNNLDDIPITKQILSSSILKKNKVFILDHLTKVDRIGTQQTIKERDVNDYPLLYIANATESIKQALNNFFRRDSEQDEVWMVKLDHMQNYKNYFPLDNPSNIEMKHIPTRSRIVPNKKMSAYFPCAFHHTSPKGLELTKTDKDESIKNTEVLNDCSNVFNNCSNTSNL